MTSRWPGRTRYTPIAILGLLLMSSGIELSAQGAGSPPPQSGQSESQPPQDHQSHQGPAPSDVFIRAFGSVNWGATDQTGVPNSFALGQLAIFATSALGERFSVLAEVVLEGSRTTEVVTDLERLQITY